MAKTAAGAWNKLQAERDEFSVCIKKLTQQLADSAEAHTEKDKAIKSLTDSNMELERERDEMVNTYDSLMHSIEQTSKKLDADLTEANALLRELDNWQKNGNIVIIVGTDDKNREAGNVAVWGCRLAAHLKKGDTDGK